ncbi:MAG: hypothetical protein K2J54_00455, partial [Clostridia bacterium]|nr:hypothetical protein [Clostridia bacterium]
MVGIYFSGTGNTKHCVQRLLQGIGGAEAYPLEHPQAAEAAYVRANVLCKIYKSKAARRNSTAN